MNELEEIVLRKKLKKWFLYWEFGTYPARLANYLFRKFDPEQIKKRFNQVQNVKKHTPRRFFERLVRSKYNI